MKKRTESENRKLLSSWRSSGLTKTAWCKQAHISRGTLNKWITEYGEGSDQGSFVPIEGFPSVDNFSTSEHLRIIYPNGVELSIPCSMIPEEIKHLINIQS